MPAHQLHHGSQPPEPSPRFGCRALAPSGLGRKGAAERRPSLHVAAERRIAAPARGLPQARDGNAGAGERRRDRRAWPRRSAWPSGASRSRSSSRRREVRELGVGINLLPHAVKELAELGLLDAARRHRRADPGADLLQPLRPADLEPSRAGSRPATTGRNSRSTAAGCRACSTAPPASGCGDARIRLGHRLVGFAQERPGGDGLVQPTPPARRCRPGTATSWSAPTASTRRSGPSSTRARGRPGGTATCSGAARSRPSRS